jgi:hypothetical protein
MVKVFETPKIFLYQIPENRIASMVSGPRSLGCTGLSQSNDVQLFDWKCKIHSHTRMWSYSMVIILFLENDRASHSAYSENLLQLWCNKTAGRRRKTCMIDGHTKVASDNPFLGCSQETLFFIDF